VLHEKVLFVTVQNEDTPAVAAAERSTVTQLAAGIHRVIGVDPLPGEVLLIASSQLFQIFIDC
jgi:hypothetical protein